MATQDFLTVEQAAHLLQVHNQTVRRWIKAGDLPAAFLGKGYRIKRSDFDAFVAQNHVTVTGEHNEPLSDDDLAAIRRGIDDIRAGRIERWEDLREEL